jgi:hypothetical protein
MRNIQTACRKPLFERGLTRFDPAAVFGVGIVGGLWFRPMAGQVWPALLAAAVLALPVVLWIVSQSRSRAARRLQDVLNTYAEREIARARSGKASKGVQTFSARRSALLSKGSERQIFRPR